MVKKGAYYYLVMTWVNTDKGKGTKWISTKIPIKQSGGKTKAKDMLVRVKMNFDPNNANVSLTEMLNENYQKKSLVVKEIEEVEDKGILF